LTSEVAEQVAEWAKAGTVDLCDSIRIADARGSIVLTVSYRQAFPLHLDANDPMIRFPKRLGIRLAIAIDHATSRMATESPYRSRLPSGI